MGINFQRLLDVCKATELLPLGGFYMGSVRNHCGTAGCMIGNYNAMAGRSLSVFGTDNECDDWNHFGISGREYFWLFAEGGNFYDNDVPKMETDYCDGLRKVTREQALSRLRKFIYYKLRKNEFIVDEKYGVRQEARTKEGNHGFAMRAKVEAESAMATV